MPFGVGDLFGIFGGAAWLAKEGIQEMCESVDNATNAELVEKFVQEHSDPELEEKYAQEILIPSNHEGFWRRIETYKRENPVWCRLEDKKWSRRCGKYKGYGWWDVGKKRLQITDAKGRLYGKTKYERDILGSNRNDVITLLIETHGKMSSGTAWLEATKFKYPLKKSKRSW